MRHLISARTFDTSLASRSLSRLSVVWCMSCAFSTSLLKPASREMPSRTDCVNRHNPLLSAQLCTDQRLLVDDRVIMTTIRTSNTE